MIGGEALIRCVKKSGKFDDTYISCVAADQQSSNRGELLHLASKW